MQGIEAKTLRNYRKIGGLLDEYIRKLVTLKKPGRYRIENPEDFPYLVILAGLTYWQKITDTKLSINDFYGGLKTFWIESLSELQEQMDRALDNFYL